MQYSQWYIIYTDNEGVKVSYRDTPEKALEAFLLHSKFCGENNVQIAKGLHVQVKQRAYLVEGLMDKPIAEFENGVTNATDD